MTFLLDIEASRGHCHLRVSLQSRGRVVAVVGRSGAGKSTLLDVIAGLAPLRRGRVVIGGATHADSERAIDRPSHARGIGVVFQDRRLFPHRSVLENIRFGSTRTGEPIVREEEVIETLGLGPLASRFPAHLSGGERQRVAIARAILSRPHSLLLDEPFSSLDAPLRLATIDLVRAVVTRSNVPTLLVTHHLEEALQLTDELLFLDGGRSIAHGAHVELVHREDVAAILGPQGFVNVLHGACETIEGELAFRSSSGGCTLLVATPRGNAVPAGVACSVSIPAHDIALAKTTLADVSIRNQLPARVQRISTHGHGALVHVVLDGTDVALISEVSQRAVETLRLAPGAAVVLLVKSQAIRFVG